MSPMGRMEYVVMNWARNWFRRRLTFSPMPTSPACTPVTEAASDQAAPPPDRGARMLVDLCTSVLGIVWIT